MIDRAVYEQLVFEARAAGCGAQLARIEDGFREYYRDGGEEELHLPGLRLQPWWDPRELVDVGRLEHSYRDIRDEVEQMLERRVGFQHYDEGECGFTPENTNRGWNVFYFRWDCADIAANHAMCPRTSACLQAIPELGAGAFYSALSGGAHLAAHTGSMGVVATVHLGLIVPDGCTLRVGDETRRWEEGRVLAFQDTFEHEARNESDRTRINLMFDVWHPQLTGFERGFLRRWAWQCGVGEKTAGVVSSPERHGGVLDNVDWWT